MSVRLINGHIDPDKMTMGEKIQNLRMKKGWSQHELARKTGVHENMPSMWERGKCEPRLLTAICLADLFQVSLDELCCRNFKG